MKIGGNIDYYQALSGDPMDYAMDVLQSGFRAPDRNVYDIYKEGAVVSRDWLGRVSERDYGGTEGLAYEQWVENLRQDWATKGEIALEGLKHYLPEYDVTSEQFAEIDLLESTKTLRNQVALEMDKVETLKEKVGFSTGALDTMKEDTYSTVQNTTDKSFHRLKKGKRVLRKGHIEDIYNMTKNLILTGAFGDFGYDEDIESGEKWYDPAYEWIDEFESQFS